MADPHWLVSLEAEQRCVLRSASDAESAGRHLKAVWRGNVQRLRERVRSPSGLAACFALGLMLGSGTRACPRATREAANAWRLDWNALAAIGLWLLRYRAVGRHRGLDVERRSIGKTAEGGA